MALIRVKCLSLSSLLFSLYLCTTSFLSLSVPLCLPLVFSALPAFRIKTLSLSPLTFFLSRLPVATDVLRVCIVEVCVYLQGLTGIAPCVVNAIPPD